MSILTAPEWTSSCQSSGLAGILPFATHPPLSRFRVNGSHRYGRWGGRPPHRRFRTGRESFPSSGSSARGTLSMVQPGMRLVVAVGVE